MHSNKFGKIDVRKIRKIKQETFDYKEMEYLSKNKSHSNDLRKMIYQIHGEK